MNRRAIWTLIAILGLLLGTGAGPQPLTVGLRPRTAPGSNRTPAPTGKTLVLAIGVDRYRDPGLAPLLFPKKNVVAVVRAFTKRGAITTSLTGTAVTRDALAEAASRFSEAARPEDTLILYFSGSVFLSDSDPGSSIPVLATYDIEPKRPDLTGISWREIVRVFDVCQAKHQIAIVDAPNNSRALASGKGYSFLSESVLSRLESGVQRFFASTLPSTAEGQTVSATAEALIQVLGSDGPVDTSQLRSALNVRGDFVRSSGDAEDFEVCPAPLPLRSPTEGGAGFSDGPDVHVELTSLNAEPLPPGYSENAKEPFGVVSLNSDRQVAVIQGIAYGKDLPKLEGITINGTKFDLNLAGDQKWFIGSAPLMPGANTVDVEVLGSGVELKRELRVTYRGPSTALAGPRQDRAVIFYTNNYDHYGSLNNPVHDATELKELLISQFGFSKVDFVPEAKFNDVIDRLEGKYLQMAYGPHDQLLVYFAGHGKYEPVTGHGYLLLKDSDESAAHVEDQKRIDFNRLSEDLYSINQRCGHLMVMIDACYGGAFALSAKSRTATPIDSPVDEAKVTSSLALRTCRYFTSGGVERVPDGGDRGDDPNHSPFAERVIQVLRDSSRKVVLGDDIERALGGMPDKYPMPKAGKFGRDEGGDFVFERRTASHPQNPAPIDDPIAKTVAELKAPIIQAYRQFALAPGLPDPKIVWDHKSSMAKPDGVLNLSRDELDTYAHDLGPTSERLRAITAFVLAHECGHLVQYQKYGAAWVLEDSRRRVVELQADLLAGAILYGVLAYPIELEEAQATNLPQRRAAARKLDDLTDLYLTVVDLAVDAGNDDTGDPTRHPTKTERSHAAKVSFFYGKCLYTTWKLSQAIAAQNQAEVQNQNLALTGLEGSAGPLGIDEKPSDWRAESVMDWTLRWAKRIEKET